MRSSSQHKISLFYICWDELQKEEAVVSTTTSTVFPPNSQMKMLMELANSGSATLVRTMSVVGLVVQSFWFILRIVWQQM